MKTKSFLLGAAAILLATACSNDEVVKVAENGAPIGFSSFVNNSTRTDYGTNKDKMLEGLKVYGVTTNAGITPFVVFNGDNVTNVSGTWTYSPLRYWITGNDYTFAAVAPLDVIVNLEEGATLEAGKVKVNQSNGMDNGGITTIELNNDGNVDLLYNSPAKLTGVAQNQATVQLNLGHLLSRVRFEFVNETSGAYALKVKDVTVKDVVKNAKYTVATSSWENTDNADFVFANKNEYTLYEASATSASKNLVPEGKTTYNASFTIELYQVVDEVYTMIDSYDHNIELPEVDYVAGNSYTLKASVDMTNVNPDEQIEPIKFNATVTDWAEQTATTVTLPQKEISNE